MLGLDGATVDRHGIAYVFAEIDAVRDRADSALLRVTPQGASVPARFGNAEPVGAPSIAADGSIAGTLANRATCFGTEVRFAPSAAHDGTIASFGHGIATKCRAITGVRDIVLAGGNRLALRAQRLVRIDARGRQTVEADLATNFGHFAGAPIPGRHGETYALATGSNGSVCMRLVRVANGGVDVLHTFRHEDGWCLPPSICLYPHLRAEGALVDVTTARGAPCATGVSIETARSFDGTYGAVAHVAKSGSLRFAFSGDQ